MTPVDQLTANTASGKSTFRTGRLQCDSRRKDKATKARARKQQALNAASIHSTLPICSVKECTGINQ